MNTIEIKKNVDLKEYQIWLNGGLLLAFDYTIFMKQQVIKCAKKIVSYGLLKGDEYTINDLTLEQDFVCSKCGSTDVESKMWFNHNTGDLEYVSELADDNYCNDCEEHVQIIPG